MKNYHKVNRTHHHLLELGKQIQEKETIKKNRKEYLDRSLKDISYLSLDNLNSKINLKNSYEAILKVLQENNLKFYNYYHNLILIIYLLQLNVKDYDKEIELLKDSEKSLSDNYDSINEELEEKEKELEIVNKKLKDLRYIYISLFIIYNYFLIYSLSEINDHLLTILHIFKIILMNIPYNLILKVTFVPLLYFLYNKDYYNIRYKFKKK